MSLADRLYELREARGLSVRVLAKMAGVCPQTVVNIENAYNKSPTKEMLVSLARALGTNIEDLLGSDENT